MKTLHWFVLLLHLIALSEAIIGPDGLISFFFNLVLATRGLSVNAAAGFNIVTPQFQVNGNAAFEGIAGVNNLAVPKDTSGSLTGTAWHPVNTTLKAAYSLLELQSGWEVRFTFNTTVSVFGTGVGRGF